MARDRFEIVLAETAGFCMGVRRAVRLVLRAADEPERPMPIRTLGPLIHNRQVLQVLARRGILPEDQPDGEPTGTAVIRAHGLPREQQEELVRRCADLLDATCPHVRRVQKTVADHAERGYACIVVGDEGHAEVNGVLSYARGHGYVVSGPHELDSVPPCDKVVVVAQTTQDEEVFRRTVEAAERRFPECVAVNTVCRSTQLRQAEVRELAPQVDAMIVVGGYNSANTRRLAELSAAAGTPTYHVETDRQLDMDRLLSCRRVGLTAGASTPNWMIKKVLRRLLDAHQRRAHLVGYLLGTFLRALVNANVFAAGAAAALTFACSRLLLGPSRLVPVCMTVSFFFVLGHHLLNQYARRESLYLSEPDRAEFFMANERTLLALAISSSALALFLAGFLGWWALALVGLGTAGGLMYRVPLPLWVGRRIGFRSLELLAGSKELFVGLAWGALAAVVPSLAGGLGAVAWRSTLTAFLVAFLMAFERTLLLDLGDVAADQIVGRETLAGVLGVRRAEQAFTATLVGLAAALGLLGGLAGWAGPPAWLMLICVPYALGCFLALRRGWRRPGEWAELAVDGQFYLAAIAAAAAGLAAAAG
jgi:4-hydroxy-3-methylbut-2-enyl diphosphate reductase